MKSLTRWIVIRNGVDVRVVKKDPTQELLSNEIAFQMNLKVPAPPKIVGVIDIELPEAPPVNAADITVEDWYYGEKIRARIENRKGGADNDNES